MANKLKLWRAYAGVTQKQLGAMLDKPVSYEMVSQWERGERKISAERLAEIRKKLKIPAKIC